MIFGVKLHFKETENTASIKSGDEDGARKVSLFLVRSCMTNEKSVVV